MVTLDYTPSHFPIAHWDEVWFRIQLDQEDRIIAWRRERHSVAGE
jgi:hypothetical protein